MMDIRKELEKIIDTKGLSDQEVSYLWMTWYDQDRIIMSTRWRRMIKSV